MNEGSRFYSDSRRCYIELQTDGNLVLYREFDRKAFWASGTHGDIPNVQFQSDGNLVMYDKGGSAVWESDTDDKGAKRMVMQEDGNFVMYDGDDKAVWSTHTSSKGACNGALPIFFSCVIMSGQENLPILAMAFIWFEISNARLEVFIFFVV